MTTTIRVTRELLEHALDLPANVTVTGDVEMTRVGEVECITFDVEVAGGVANGPSGIVEGGSYALQYEETDFGLTIVSAVAIQ